MIDTIQTRFFILSQEDYHSLSQDAKDLNVSIDYLLFEFCDVEGEKVYVN
jgi:hypothetical protein